MVNKNKTIIALIILLITIATATAAVDTGIDTSFYADEGTSHLLNTTTPYNLTETGTVPNFANGLVNTARGPFDTTDYFEATTIQQYDNTEDWTVSIWYNLNETLSGGECIWAEKGNGLNRWVYWDGTDSWNVPMWTATFNSAEFIHTPIAGVWNQIVATFDSATNIIMIYHNGIAGTQSSYVDGAAGPMTVLTIGTDDGHTQDTPFIIDEITQWPRVLTGAEINESYDRGIAGNHIFEAIVTPTTIINITPNDAYNASIIPNYNAIITYSNGTTQNIRTTNGSVSLVNVSDSDLTINVTIYNNTNYYNQTVLNEAITANVTNTVTPIITPKTSGFHIQINATSFYNSSTILNITADINGTNHTSNTNGQIDTGIQQNETYLYNITLYSPGHNDRTLTNKNATADGNITTVLLPSTPYYLTIIVRDNTNTTNLTSATVTVNHTGETQNNNPFQHDVNNYINLTVQNLTIQINVTDNNLLNINYTSLVNITNTQRTFYIIMDPNKLQLSFQQNGAAHSVSGFIADENKSRNFTNSSMVVVQHNLTTGYVHVRFNDMLNWTQYYEYINNYDTHIDETLEVITSADWYAYFQILDYTNSPLEDVTIRAYFSMHDNIQGNWTYHKLFGQRLTKADGYSFFWCDAQAETYWYIYKEGYAPMEMLLTIGDESFTRDEPLTLYLQASETTVTDNAWIYIQNTITNKTLDINSTITAIDRTTVQITTNYRTSQGLGLRELTGDSLDRYNLELKSGTDFQNTGTDDIYLQVYFDNTLWQNITITYDNANKTAINIASKLTPLNSKFVNPLALIALIILSAAIGMLLKNDEVTPTAFKIGSILLTLVSVNFLWLGCIFLAGATFKQIRRIISE